MGTEEEKVVNKLNPLVTALKKLKHEIRIMKNVYISGRTVEIASRGTKAWLAKLGEKDKKFGRKREFIVLTSSRTGMNKQKVIYKATDLEPGEYECAGNEFGEFRYTFEIK